MDSNFSIDSQEVDETCHREQINKNVPSYSSIEQKSGDERILVDLKEEEIHDEDLNYRMPIYRSSCATEQEWVSHSDRVYKNSKSSAAFSLPNSNFSHSDAIVSIGNFLQYDTVKNNVEDIHLDSARKYSGPIAVSSDPKHLPMKTKPLIPSVDPEFRQKMESLEIQVLSIIENAPNSIVITIPPKIVDKEKDCMKYVRETLGMLYTEMKKVPNLTFVENSKELKFWGSYCWDYGVCSFDAQMWKIDPSMAKGNLDRMDYIIHFSRKSLHGRDAFEQIVQQIAAFLLEWGRAKKYANGFNIYPWWNASMDLEEDIYDDILFDKVTQSPSEMSSESGNDCQIILDSDLKSDLICFLAKPISEMFAYGEENIRLLAMSSKNIDNCELMAEEPKLHEALCSELKNGRNPSSCANTLVILKAILKYHPAIAGDSLREYGILDAVTRSLLSYNTFEPKLSLGSVFIERAALTLLEMLIGNQKIRFSLFEMEKVLTKLEKHLGGKLKDQSGKILSNLITALKKRTTF